MVYEIRSTSPDGRFQLRVNTWEAGNTLWVSSPEIFDLAAGQPVFRFQNENWSLDQDEWESDSRVRLTLRKYPGNHLPGNLTVGVDCANGVAYPPNAAAVSLDRLEEVLDRQLTWGVAPQGAAAERPKQRPAAVLAIGSLSVGCGTLVLLASMCMLTLGGVMRMPNEGMPPPGTSEGFQTASRLVGNITLGVCTPMILAVIFIFAGVAFLQLRPWARQVMEALVWAALVYNIGSGVYEMWGFYSFMNRLTFVQAGGSPGYEIFFLGYRLVMMLVVTLLLGGVIIALRSASVRAAMDRQRGIGRRL